MSDQFSAGFIAALSFFVMSAVVVWIVRKLKDAAYAEGYEEGYREGYDAGHAAALKRRSTGSGLLSLIGGLIAIPFALGFGLLKALFTHEPLHSREPIGQREPIIDVKPVHPVIQKADEHHDAINQMLQWKQDHPDAHPDLVKRVESAMKRLVLTDD